jgi:hypothetical protein
VQWRATHSHAFPLRPQVDANVPLDNNGNITVAVSIASNAAAEVASNPLLDASVFSYNAGTGRLTLHMAPSPASRGACTSAVIRIRLPRVLAVPNADVNVTSGSTKINVTVPANLLSLEAPLAHVTIASTDGAVFVTGLHAQQDVAVRTTSGDVNVRARARTAAAAAARCAHACG